jgi:diguanylate cyclase (GGDEF)-like protein
MPQFLNAQSAKARLASLGEALDLVETPVVLLGRDMRAWFVNESFAQLWAVPSQLLATGPSFHDLLNHAMNNGCFAACEDGLPALVEQCEAEVRAAAAAPTEIELRNGRRVMLRCVVSANGGRIVICTDVTPITLEDEQRQTREAAEQWEAELRFTKETLEEHASYLASLAEDSDANARRAEEAKRQLEHEIAERLQLEAELRRLATTDALTGTLNRRQLFKLAQEELSRARERGHGLAVLMLDIDHFKRINDSYGHPTGDEALKHLAGRLRASVRQADLIGRLGGEEFAVVLPAITLQAALRVAAGLRAGVEEMPVTQGARRINMTISIGLSLMHDTDYSIEQVIARADEALYQAKDGGRNRVCHTEPAVQQ